MLTPYLVYGRQSKPWLKQATSKFTMADRVFKEKIATNHFKNTEKACELKDYNPTN